MKEICVQVSVHKTENSLKIMNAILYQIPNEILVKPLYRDLRRGKKVKWPSLRLSVSVGHPGSFSLLLQKEK